MTLQWPLARLRIDAAVAGGVLQLAGDAKINDDKDGLTLSNFLVAYPGNTLHLARDANVHFRSAVVLEPIELLGDHGSVRLQAQLEPPPGRIDAAVVVSNFELDRLPQFAMPKGLDLHGVLEANAVVQAPRATPDLDLRAGLRGAGARPAGDLSLDAHVHAHVHRGVLQTEGWAAGSGLVRVDFQGELPVQAIATQPSNEPVQLEVRLAQLDLTRLAETAKLPALQQEHARGVIDARIVASGSLAAPRATVSLEARGLGTQTIQQVDARAGLLIEKGTTAFDGSVQLGGEPALALTAQIPFDLARALRDRTYLRGMLDRPLQADLAVTQLPLERLSRSGILPTGSSGTVSLSARLSGTPRNPTLDVNTTGNEVNIGRLHGRALRNAGAAGAHGPADRAGPVRTGEEARRCRRVCGSDLRRSPVARRHRPARRRQLPRSCQARCRSRRTRAALARRRASPEWAVVRRHDFAPPRSRLRLGAGARSAPRQRHPGRGREDGRHALQAGRRGRCAPAPGTLRRGRAGRVRGRRSGREVRSEGGGAPWSDRELRQ